RYGPLRRNHRLALPFLARTFSTLPVPEGIVLCSSSGWAHGAPVRGRKIVLFHSEARWLYQTSRYLGGPRPVARAALAALRPALQKWDRAAATGADLYLVASRAVRRRIHDVYGVHAALLPFPWQIDPSGAQRAVPGIEEGF